MKKTILTGASLIAFALAAPAHAQNSSTINQTGNSNAADVTHTGGNTS